MLSFLDNSPDVDGGVTGNHNANSTCFARAPPTKIILKRGVGDVSTWVPEGRRVLDKIKYSLGNYGHALPSQGRTQQKSYFNPFLAPKPASVISCDFQALTSDDPASNFLYFTCYSKGGEVRNKSLMR